MKNLNFVKFYFFFVAVMLISISSFDALSQGVSVNPTGAAADPSAIFDANSSNQGMLIPRLSTLERNAIANPAVGLQIFNTTTMCFEYYAYGVWQQIHCAVCPLPLAAGSVSGSASVCQGDNSVAFSVPAITNATSYVWLYSGSGASIVGNTNSVIVNFSGSATSGVLTVKGNNHCGDGTASPDFNITVNQIPAAPAAGIHSPSQTGITWNWTTVAGATGYKYNTLNDYAAATDVGVNTSYAQAGLNCNTSYSLYVWAYNNCGYSSAAVLGETTSACWSCGSLFTDSRDSKTYETVLIGSQCWFKKNLDYGIQISLNTNSSNNGIAEKYCYDDNVSNCNQYGALYQWNEAMNWTSVAGGQGLCPSGWHIPTNSEWASMISTNPSAIQSVNSGVLCNGGNCGGNIYYANLGNYGYYWTSSEFSSAEAYRRIFMGSSLHQSDYMSKLMGLSIRCVLN